MCPYFFFQSNCIHAFWLCKVLKSTDIFLEELNMLKVAGYKKNWGFGHIISLSHSSQILRWTKCHIFIHIISFMKMMRQEHGYLASAIHQIVHINGMDTSENIMKTGTFYLWYARKYMCEKCHVWCIVKFRFMWHIHTSWTPFMIAESLLNEISWLT